MHRDMYKNGSYLDKHPTWHVEHSPWKAEQIIRMISRNNVVPKTICEIGCGAGEILVQLQSHMNKEMVFWGFEISPQALELCKKRANEKLHFELGDVLQKKDVFFDLVLMIDLIEHIEDFYGFLRQMKQKGKYKIIHIPLNLSVQSLMRIKTLLKIRKRTGHIHFFTKDLALQALEDVGYEVRDYFYTAGAIELSTDSITRYLARIPRKIFFTVNNDLAVRVMGGYSLLVLAR